MFTLIRHHGTECSPALFHTLILVEQDIKLLPGRKNRGVCFTLGFPGVLKFFAGYINFIFYIMQISIILYHGNFNQPLIKNIVTILSIMNEMFIVNPLIEDIVQELLNNLWLYLDG